MNYPFWDVPIGYGLLMAVIAVVHVFVSHFAIGGGLFLVVTEQRARKTGDQPMLDYLAKLSKFFALTTLVFGALTGVGIWFIIGLLNPTATEALIHNYVWGWAIEWTFFVTEITAALLYYYGWQRLTPAAHLAIGWIYFAAAWLSLVIINGIITFMLTPGQWLVNGEFWTGFFNPTYWPSLVMRTGVCIMLAGLYGLLVAARYEAGDLKRRLVRETTTWGLLGLVITAAAEAWYWRAIPVTITTKAMQIMPIPMQALRSTVWLAAAIGALLIIARAAARRLPVVVAGVLMVTGLAWFGEFEMFREALRKPYVITGYIYGNGVEVALTDRYKKEGYAAQIAYKTGDEGTDLFLHSCRSCHTIDGYHALKPAFDGTDRKFIAEIIRGAHLLKGNMPPFLGTPAEADKIAGYIYERIDHRPLADICRAEGVDLGPRAYAVRCGNCHMLGTTHDKSKSFAGQSADDLGTMLDNSAALGDGMPDYTGPPEERAALVAYLQTLGKQVKK
ncbi:MAG TPA: c-type cytochrome [Verrucomicrobiae bacterium]|nr:c-type cytochrome [Verrucomicrobiae bacterium]